MRKVGGGQVDLVGHEARARKFVDPLVGLHIQHQVPDLKFGLFLKSQLDFTFFAAGTRIFVQG